MLDEFAAELHEAREKSGISLQQMALKTRVDIKFLEAIDRGDFAFLPEPYVKAFLKDYAKMVGLDESKTIQKFEAAKKGKALEEKSEIVSENEINKEEKSAPKKTVHTYDATPPKPTEDKGSGLKKNIVANGLILGGGLIVIFIIYLLFIKGSNEIIVSEKPIEEVIQDNQRFEQPVSNASDNTQPSDTLSLTVLSSDTSWVQIIYDDKKLEEFTLFPNSQKTIKTGNNFKITLGNAGAINFRLNDQQINYSGKKGSVAYVQINENGLTYLKTPPSLNNND